MASGELGHEAILPESLLRLFKGEKFHEFAINLVKDLLEMSLAIVTDFQVLLDGRCLS